MRKGVLVTPFQTDGFSERRNRDVVVAIGDKIVMMSASVPSVGIDIQKEAGPSVPVLLVLSVVFL